MSETREVVELTFDKMEQYFNAAKGVIEQYGGDVAELGLMALRVEAISELIRPLLLLVLVVASVPMLKKACKWITEVQRADECNPWFFLYIGPSAAVLIGFVALTKLFNIWAWAGIFYPELYAVHKFILS